MTAQDRACAARLILVRHGESEGNRDRTFTQDAEVPLTATGRGQAHATAGRIVRLYRPTRIVASPLARAWQTAEILAAALRLEVQPEVALREQSFGVFAGQPYAVMLSDAAYHEGPRWHWRPPGGESLVDVCQRAVPAFDRLARGSIGEEIVVVSHGGVMLALCAYVSGSWEGLTVTPNAGIVVVEYRRGRFGRPRPVADE
ncbi:MAG: histidine phosphatase family protein [Candidatus Binatia bacterium]